MNCTTNQECEGVPMLTELETKAILDRQESKTYQTCVLMVDDHLIASEDDDIPTALGRIKTYLATKEFECEHIGYGVNEWYGAQTHVVEFFPLSGQPTRFYQIVHAGIYNDVLTVPATALLEFISEQDDCDLMEIQCVIEPVHRPDPPARKRNPNIPPV